jgi:membrane protease YdiL (CAAX protease family)
MNQRLHIQDAGSHHDHDVVYLSSAGTLSVYIVGLTLAETLAALSQVLLSCFAHALLIVLMLAPAVFAQRVLARCLLAVLALISVTRLMTLTLFANRLPRLSTYLILTALLLVAIGTTVRVLDFSLLRLGLRLWSWPPQLLIAISGVPLSLAAFLILWPQIQLPVLDGIGTLAGTLIVLGVSGLAEELLFRGLLQQVLKEIFGGRGYTLGAAIFALSYIGSAPWSYVLFIGVLGLFFGWCVHRTSSIHGVALAHAIMLIGAVCVWPSVMSELNSNGVRQFVAFSQVGGWLCAALLLGLAGLGLLRLLRRAILFVSRQINHS